jgi:hypothetical protein
MATKDSGGGNNRNGEGVPNVVNQQTTDSFFTAGASDPRDWAGKNGVDTGKVPLSHVTGASDFYSVAENIGRSSPQHGLRPEAQTKQQQKQITPIFDAVIDGKKSK